MNVTVKIDTFKIDPEALAFGNRVLDYLEGRAQREVDTIVDELRTSTDGLESVIAPALRKPSTT